MTKLTTIVFGSIAWAGVLTLCEFTASEAVGATLAIGLIARLFTLGEGCDD